MNKVVFIAVHPDDETLGCGGTILKHKENGDEIYWLIVTSINKKKTSSYNDAEILERQELINEVSKEYGFNKTYQLGFPTTHLHSIDLLELINEINSVFNEVKPNIIYTMFNHDVHSDHRVAFDAVYSCTKSFRKPYIERLYMFEALSETEFALSTPATTFIPNVYVDISKYIDKKLEIMSMYESELMEAPYPRSLSSIEALARLRGSRCGSMYAEAFMLLYEKR
jgi:LmbE family N-acetylglucosaminyl deacetylase